MLSASKSGIRSLPIPPTLLPLIGTTLSSTWKKESSSKTCSVHGKSFSFPFLFIHANCVQDKWRSQDVATLGQASRYWGMGNVSVNCQCLFQPAVERGEFLVTNFEQYSISNIRSCSLQAFYSHRSSTETGTLHIQLYQTRAYVYQAFLCQLWFFRNGCCSRTDGKLLH